MKGLPPHNQRRLNHQISETFGGRYADWYALADEIRQQGGTLNDIRDRFAALGIRVSIYTVHIWLKRRDREDMRAAA